MSKLKPIPRWLFSSIKMLAALAAMLLLVLWLMGAFHDKVEPGPVRRTLRAFPDAARMTVKMEKLPVFESAVGTVEAVERIAVSSRLLGRIEAMHVKAGQPVKQGDVLVELEKKDLVAGLEKARAVHRSAEAALRQAEIDQNRAKELFAQKIAPKSRLEEADTAVKRAKAELERAGEAITEAQSILDHATIRAPSSGIVIDKHVEPGNMASPGTLLVTLYDPKHLQLVAMVREQIAIGLRVGQLVKVRLDALDKNCEARIAQIVPEAEPQSRAFSVKVTGACPPNVYSGMFGRILLPVGEREEIHVPKSAIRTHGQLEFVFVVLPDGGVLRRFVRTGRRSKRGIEILSGLRAGETIIVDSTQVDLR